MRVPGTVQKLASAIRLQKREQRSKEASTDAVDGRDASDAFTLALCKLAERSSPEAERRKRRAYYVAHRQQILQQSTAYRRKNSAQIRRRQAKYRRQVRSGSKRQRKRVSVSGGGYQFAGFK